LGPRALLEFFDPDRLFADVPEAFQLRCRSGSVAPAAVSHAVYKLSLYLTAGVRTALGAIPSTT
jgi:hypothetical protein